MRTSKLLMNKRFLRLLDLVSIVDKKYNRREYVSTLDIIISNAIVSDDLAPKSIYIQTFR